MGSLYNHLNKIEKAIECYKKAININPKFSFAHLNIGASYISLGKFIEARKHLNEALNINPNLFVVHRLLSKITKYTEKNEHLKNLEEIYKDINKNDEEKNIEISFSLGKAYEDLKKYDKSFYNVTKIIIPETHNSVSHAYHLYPLQINFDALALTKPKFFQRMKDVGVNLQVHYIPVHLLSYYQERYGHKRGDFPIAENYYDRTISIPLYPSLTNDEVEKVVKNITSFVESKY